MPSQRCFLCASDEGIFLDISGNEGKAFRGQIETCLSFKFEDKQASNKICHKCAYELTQCNDFVQKYKRGQETKNKSKGQAKRCSLCLETSRKERILYYTKDNSPANGLFEKICKVFDEKVIKHEDDTMICLKCRYNLDVLSDLQHIFERTRKFERMRGEIDYVKLQKIETTVVQRKTTTNESQQVRTIKTRSKPTASTANESIASTASTASTADEKSDVCSECQCSIERRVIYKHQKTGKPLCKSCWSTANEKEETKNKKKTATKPCAVFLKDVFTDDKVFKKAEENESRTRRTNRKRPTTETSTDNEKRVKESINLRSRQKNNTRSSDSEIVKNTKIDVIPSDKKSASDTEGKRYRKRRKELAHEDVPKRTRLSKKSSSKSEDTEEESEKEMSDRTKEVKEVKEVKQVKEEYTCEECGVQYKNKLVGLTHKLTHYKQPEVKLHKIAEKDQEDKTPETENGESAAEALIRVEDDSDDDDNVLKEKETISEDKTIEEEEDEPDWKIGKSTDDVIPEKEEGVVIRNGEKEEEKSEEKEKQGKKEDAEKEKPEERVEQDETEAEKDELEEKEHDEKNELNEKGESENVQKNIEEDKEVIEAEEGNMADEKDTESETDINIVDPGSSENSTEKDVSNIGVVTETETGTEEVEEKSQHEQDKQTSSVECNPTEDDDTSEKKDNQTEEKDNENADSDKHHDGNQIKELEKEAPKEATETIEQSKPNVETHPTTNGNNSANAVEEVLQELFDMATAEAEKRENAISEDKVKQLEHTEAETLENISREVRNSADMPSLDEES